MKGGQDQRPPPFIDYLPYLISIRTQFPIEENSNECISKSDLQTTKIHWRIPGRWQRFIGVLRAVYQTRHWAKIAYGLLKNTNVKRTLQDAQNARSERLQMQFRLQAVHWSERASPEGLRLLDSTQSTESASEAPENLRALSRDAPAGSNWEKYRPLEELVDQVLWLNASLGNWSYVLHTLELKVKLTGKKKQDWNLWEMLNSLELAEWVWIFVSQWLFDQST